MATVFMMLNARIGQEKEIIEKIKQILENESLDHFEIQGVLGVYDIVVKLAGSDEHLRKIALQKIRPIENIRSAITIAVWD